MKKKEVLYTTKEWKDPCNNHYCNEYRQEGNIITKVKCSWGKFFDGKESEKSESEKVLETWKKGDPNIPEWLQKFIK